MDRRPLSRGKFIRLGAALGLGSVGASVMAACGGGGSSGGGGGTPTATGGPVKVVEGGPEVAKGQPIAKESEVAADTAFPFVDADIGQQSVLVRLKNGEFAAYSAVCTHQACIVGYQPETQKLACPCHGSVFDPARDAAVEVGPATLPLPKVGIEVRDGEVTRI